MILKPIELNRPQASFIMSQSERVLLHCGQGFGKTFVEGLIPGFFVMRCPDSLGLIGANTYGQLSDSTLFRIFQVWEEHFGWKEYHKGNPDGFYVIDKQPPEVFKRHPFTFKTNSNKIFFRNGAVIMTASLDNYMALDGREIGWAVLDETKDTNEAAIKEVITSRLRAPGIHLIKDFKKEDLFGFTNDKDPRAGEQANPLFIATSPSKNKWLSDMFKLDQYRVEIESTIFDRDDYFCKRDRRRSVIIASSWWNKKHLPPNYIELKLEEVSKEMADMLVYGSPFGKVGSEYYFKFDRRKHVCPDVALDPMVPLHISFDFNTNPYMTLVVSQIKKVDERIKVRIIDEFCLSSPNNSIEAVCRAFINKYGPYCKNGLYYYGDASGKNTLPIEEARNFYKIVDRNLTGYITHDSKRLLKKNPNHKAIGKGTIGRREFMNKILSGSMGIDVEVAERCKKTILDFEMVREDENGAKNKKKELVNGVMCEPYGHCTDALDGFFAYLWMK